MARGFRRNEAVDAAVVRAASAPLSDEDMLAFAHNRHEAVREAIAERPDATTAALLVLATDDAAPVRRAVAAHEAIAGEPAILEALANDRDAAVVAALVRNPAVPVAAKESLRARPEAEVRRAFAIADGDAPAAAGPALGGRLRGVAPGGAEAGDLTPGRAAPPRHRTAPVRGFRGTDEPD